MDYYAGIDVSLEQNSVCVVDASGKIMRETKLVRWSRFLRQGHKVDHPMKRTIQHEDTQTVYGRVQGQGCA